MDYDGLTKEEIEKLMKNLTVLDGKTLDYCYKLMKQAKEFMGPEEAEECVKYLNVIEDRVDINIQKIIMRRGMLSDNDPLAKFMGQETKLDTSLADQLRSLQLQVDKLMKPVPKQSSLRRQVTSPRN